MGAGLCMLNLEKDEDYIPDFMFYKARKGTKITSDF